MYGAQGAFYFKYIAGLRQQDTSYGYQSILVDPIPTNPPCQYLTSANATTMTPRGQLSSSWTCTPSSFTLGVALPAGPISTIRVAKFGMGDGLVVKEGGTVVWQGGKFMPGVEGVDSGKDDGDAIAFGVAAGVYSFSVGK